MTEVNNQAAPGKNDGGSDVLGEQNNANPGAEQSAPIVVNVGTPGIEPIQEYPEVEAPMLTDKDKQTFEAVLKAENVALLSGFYDGTPTGLICFFSREDDGSIKVYPVGVMLTAEMASKVRDDLGQPLPIL